MKLRAAIVTAATLIAFAGSPLWAETFTFKASNGGEVAFEVPDDWAGIISTYREEIQGAINDNNVSYKKLSEARDQFNTLKTEYLNKTDSDINTILRNYDAVTRGLDGFTDALSDSIPNAQTAQNVWAQAFIGKLFPGFPHFGLGINAGAATLDLTSLKTATTALGMEEDVIPDTLIFPSLTADIRLGGIILPFDVGLTLMKLDTSKIDAFSSLSDEGLGVDYFAIGADFRYALIPNGKLHSRVSVIGGFYYTKGDFSLEQDEADADLSFKTLTFSVGAQASAKLLFLVPYVGGRVLFTKTSVDYSVTPHWGNLLGDEASEYESLINNFLPSTFSGNATGGFAVRPQLYAGLGLDIFVIDITAGVSYTFISNVLAASVSLRFSL